MFRLSIRSWASALFAVALLAIFYLAGNWESQAQKETGIAEVVFRKLLEMPDVTHYPEGRGVCISNDNHRFDSRFLKRFQPQFPGLRFGVSSATVQGQSAMIDPKAGKCEVSLSLGEIYWMSPREAYADGGYYCGNLCAYGGHFHVRRSGWGWYVDSVADSFVSDLLRSTNSHPVESSLPIFTMETSYLLNRVPTLNLR